VATNKYMVCSNAMILLGAGQVTGFSQASTEEIVAEELYEATVTELLSAYRWRFACKYVQLDRIAEAPLMRWDAAYQLPSNASVVHGLYVNDTSIDFDRQEDQLLCNAGEDDVVVCLLGFRPNESDFPPYFESALRFRLASLFAIPVADDSQKANMYDGMFQRAFAQARSIESQGRTAQKLPVGGLRRYHAGRA
jgi:hypothetical protein